MTQEHVLIFNTFIQMLSIVDFIAFAANMI